MSAFSEDICGPQASALQSTACVPEAVILPQPMSDPVRVREGLAAIFPSSGGDALLPSHRDRVAQFEPLNSY